MGFTSVPVEIMSTVTAILVTAASLVGADDRPAPRLPYIHRVRTARGRPLAVWAPGHAFDPGPHPVPLQGE